MTTLLAPAELGKVSLVMAATAFFALFLVNPVGMFINRRLHSWVDLGSVKSHFIWYSAYITVVSIVAGIVVLAFTSAGVVHFGIATGWVIALVCGSLLFNTLNTTFIPSLPMIGHMKPFLVLTLGTIALGLAIASGLTIAWRPVAEAWLLGILLGQLILGVIGYNVFFSYIKRSEDPPPALTGKKLRRLLRFAWPVSVAVGFNWVQMQGYRFLLADHVGLSDLGLFVAGYGVASSLLAALEILFMTYFQPIFYKDTNAKDAAIQSGAWNRYASVLVPVAIIGIAAVVAAGPDLTFVMLGPNYQSASRFVVLGAFAEGGRILTGTFSLIAHQRMETAMLIFPSALGALISIGLIWVLLPIYGVNVAPVAVAIGGLVVVLHLYITARMKAPLHLDYRRAAIAISLGLALVIATRLIQLPIAHFGSIAKFLGLLFVGICVVPIAYGLLRTPLAEARLHQLWRSDSRPEKTERGE